jgi:hypothetical protein
MNTTYQPTPDFPGKTLGITAFVLSFFLQGIALIFGIIAIFQSRKAGVPNNLAVAGVVISVALLIAAAIVWIAIGASRLSA